MILYIWQAEGDLEHTLGTSTSLLQQNAGTVPQFPLKTHLIRPFFNIVWVRGPKSMLH